MVDHSQKKMVIGFLENLSYDAVDNLVEKHGLESRLIRKDMINTIQELFESKKVPYQGPVVCWQYPFGGYFFKINIPQGEKDLKKTVLQKLSINNSLKLPLKGYKDSDISLGFLIMAFPDDENPGRMDWYEDNAQCLAKHAKAYFTDRREREEQKTEPYFIEIDEDLKQKFPI